MPNGGRLTISAENQTVDANDAARDMQAKPGRYVCITVTDSATGIPPQIIDRIFEPFFTTKEINRGTGLGLSTVIAIVKSHEGFAQVQSAPGKGAIFKVFLPAMEKPLEPANLTQPTMMPRGNGETILVVEDEAAILNATCQTLTAFGYRVLSARDGAEALAVYSANKARIAIVLTDMMMPGMDGANLVGALLNLNPAIKIVQASGFILDSSRNSVPPTADKHFLAKPYTAERLQKTMRARLDEA